jgi:hypothetical protein
VFRSGGLIVSDGIIPVPALSTSATGFVSNVLLMWPCFLLMWPCVCCDKIRGRVAGPDDAAAAARHNDRQFSADPGNCACRRLQNPSFCAGLPCHDWPDLTRSWTIDGNTVTGKSGRRKLSPPTGKSQPKSCHVVKAGGTLRARPHRHGSDDRKPAADAQRYQISVLAKALWPAHSCLQRS